MVRFYALFLSLLAGFNALGKTHFVITHLFPAVNNPSFVGIENQSRYVLQYQYLTFGTNLSQSKYALYTDHFITKLRSGIGLDFLQDVQLQNSLQRSHIGLTYSFKLQITEISNLRLGLRAGYTLRSLSKSYVFPDQIFYDGQIVKSDSETLPSPIKHNFTVSLGGSFQSPLFFAGISANNLLGRREITTIGNFIEPLNIKVTTGGKLVFKNAKSPILYPQLLYEYSQGIHEITIGSNLHYSSLIFGVFYAKQIKGGNFVSGSITLSQSVYSISYGYRVSILDSSPTHFGNTHHIAFMLKINHTKKKTPNFFNVTSYLPY